MEVLERLDLQLFAGEGGEGGAAPAGGGIAAPSGDTAAPGQQRLQELGVPADKLKDRAKKDRQAAAAGKTPNRDAQASSRLSWEEIMADPEYNRQMQLTVQSRLREAKGAQEKLAALDPALEVLARKYGMDPAALDHGALTQAVLQEAEPSPASAAGPLRQPSGLPEGQTRETSRQTQLRQRFDQIARQAQDMKKTYPNFDLQKEMAQSKTFARLMAPDMPLSVEQAYHAVHFQELQGAAMQVAAQKTAQKLSNAIRAGGLRPQEAGTTAQAPSVTTFNYRNASPAQREALKRQIREAAARGEKVYPGLG